MNDVIDKQLSKGKYRNNTHEEALIRKYEEIGLGKSDICKICRGSVDDSDELSLPISAWCIGDAFYNQAKRLLFVGKTARGNPGKVRGNFRDAFAVTREFLWWETYDVEGEAVAMPSAYWGYTAEITKRLFGKDSPECISFTNIVKCNNSPDIDTTNSIMKECCIRRFKVLTNEIRHICPTHIVFYTGNSYDDYIADVFDQYTIDVDGKRKIGNIEMPWQEGVAHIDDMSFKVLRVGHPERKKKEEFITSIVDWVNK